MQRSVVFVTGIAMNAHHVKYLLVGGGLASSCCAQAIREIDGEGSIVLVGQEIVRPYHRPPLSKDYLRRQSQRDDLFTHGRDWFEKNGIELRTGRRAARLDVGRNAVTLDQGQVIAYDKLLLATGMSPRPLEIPGADLPGLFYLRTLEDAHHLQTAADKARAEGHPHVAGARTAPLGKAAVIGASFLGTELASSLNDMQLSVDLICGGNYPWDDVAGEIVGKAVTAFLASHGVRVHSSARPSRIEGDGRVQRVVLADGTSVICDLAVAAVGGIAHRELLRGTPIAAEKAILTDPHCRTNVPNIYCAGDCAAIFDPLFGKHRLLDHWDHARITGRLAGRNMAGIDEAFSGVNQFYCNLLGLSLQGWGEWRQVDRRLVRAFKTGNGDPDLIEIGIASDGRVAQTLALGHAADHEALRNLVARRVQVDGIEESLKDPAVDLAQLLDGVQ